MKKHHKEAKSENEFEQADKEYASEHPLALVVEQIQAARINLKEHNAKFHSREAGAALEALGSALIHLDKAVKRAEPR